EAARRPGVDGGDAVPLPLRPDDLSVADELPAGLLQVVHEPVPQDAGINHLVVAQVGDDAVGAAEESRKRPLPRPVLSEGDAGPLPASEHLPPGRLRHIVTRRDIHDRAGDLAGEAVILSDRPRHPRALGVVAASVAPSLAAPDDARLLLAGARAQLQD